MQITCQPSITETLLKVNQKPARNATLSNYTQPKVCRVFSCLSKGYKPAISLISQTLNHQDSKATNMLLGNHSPM